MIHLTEKGKTKRDDAKDICKIVVILAIIGLFLLFNGGTDNEVPAPTPTPTSTLTPTVTIDDIKNAVTSISYDELMRNSDNYVGEIVYKRGEILQVIEGRGDKYDLRVATRQSEYGYYEDVVLIEYEGKRLLEGDIIDMWGESEGLEMRDLIFGGQVTIPKINSLHVELVTKAGNNR